MGFLGHDAPPKVHEHDYPETTLAYRRYGLWALWGCTCGKAFRLEYGGTQYNEDWYKWVERKGITVA